PARDIVGEIAADLARQALQSLGIEAALARRLLELLAGFASGGLDVVGGARSRIDHRVMRGPERLALHLADREDRRERGAGGDAHRGNRQRLLAQDAGKSALHGRAWLVGKLG